METNQLSKTTKIIVVIIIAVVLLGIIIYLSMNKKEEFVYGTVESSNSSENTFIEDFKSYEKFISKTKVEDTITINFKKYLMEERYTEDFFKTKKLAVIVVSEDTSKNYIHDVHDVTYNKDKTQATIKYTYKTDGYAGTLSRQWNTCMFVELDNTVTSVDFVLDNETENEK